MNIVLQQKMTELEFSNGWAEEFHYTQATPEDNFNPLKLFNSFVDTRSDLHGFSYNLLLTRRKSA